MEYARNFLNLSEVEIQRIVSVEVKPAGYEGWWAEQKAKKRIAPAA